MVSLFILTPIFSNDSVNAGSLSSDDKSKISTASHSTSIPAVGPPGARSGGAGWIDLR